MNETPGLQSADAQPRTDPGPPSREGERACRHCGSPIAGLPFARAGEDYCCEGCFLKQRESGRIPAWRVEAHTGLAEALVAALDARESETGLLSKRVACHTLPLSARLFAVIDALDAMTSDRPYREALSFDAAKAEILRSAGAQFDPQAVEAFVAEEATLRSMVTLKCERDVAAAGDGL